LFLAIFLFGLNATTSYAQMSKKLLKDADLPPIENKDGEPEMISYKDQLIQLIEKEDIFLQPDVSDDAIARLLRTSSSVVKEIMEQDFGHSFNDFLNKRRITTAVEKLDHPDFQHPDYQEKDAMEDILTEVALNVGYTSKGQFSRMFKKYQDISAEKYVEANIEKYLKKNKKGKKSKKEKEVEGQKE